ncbi:MAG: ATP-binding protein, partial [Kiritimatiellae bacterium]|nr:ATP-binding protein [Kiritimatiellia bacterium]
MTPRDGHIRVLPLHVANKIAAGEVVERPASIVKEFIENALDAGARNIKVTIAQGGRKLVAVQDDGCGMTREDALLSLERQATSKILDVDDIEEINTFGFRGEAIPSIASVSRFTMTTRRSESDEGFRLVVNAGSLDETGTAGCPPGTTVEARDLFCNVPARRKFLKSYATEEGHVKNVFTVAAIANPSVSFTLVIDGREVSRLSAAENTVDR